MAYKSINPWDQKLHSSFDNISDDRLESILLSGHKAFLHWRNQDHNSRAAALLRLADLLEEESEAHGIIITEEMGKPLAQSVAEVKKSALACRYYAETAAEALKGVEIRHGGKISVVRFDPQGVVFAIMPWNFPYWQLFRCLAPAFAAGNAVVLKHASNVPRSAAMIEDVVGRAGFPPGLFHNLFISHEQAGRVIASPFVRSISLTGSNYAGERVASLAGSSVKRCVLELGGSDPFIVFPGADLRKAAEAAVTGRFQNSGQSCIASKRLFLHEQIYNEFMGIFRPLVEALVTGDPLDPATDIGPLVNREAVDILADQVLRSVSMGARISTGQLPGPTGCLFEPLILESVPDDAPAAAEETFGPVLPVFSFSGYDELVMRVNGSRFGLGSSVWTDDMELAARIASDLDTGTVTVNGFTRSDPALPFGGVKDSGYGRELSEWGLMEFVNIKTVSYLG